MASKKPKTTSSMTDVISKFSTKKNQAAYDIKPDALNKVWNQIHLGTLYGLWAHEGAGKTTLVAQAIRSLLRQGLKGIFIDVEKAFNENQQITFQLKEFVDSGQLLIVTVDNFMELEEVFLAIPGSGIQFAVVDSWTAVKAYTPDGLRVTDVRPGLSALQESHVIGKLKQICYHNDVAGFILAHARANIQIGFHNAYAPEKKMAGGHAFKHMLEVVTEIQLHGQIKDEDDDKQVIGVEISIFATKNKWTKPNVRYREQLYYGIGIDPKRSIIARALLLGIMTKVGRTITVPGSDTKYNRRTILDAPIEVFKHLKELIDAHKEDEGDD